MKTTGRWFIRGKSGYGELIKQELIKRGATIDLDHYHYNDESHIYYIVDNFVSCRADQSESGIYITKNWREIKLGEPTPNPQFKHFEEVIVCDGEGCQWGINLYERYDETYKEYPHICMTGRYVYCIPREGNEHLIGVKFKPEHITDIG